MTLTYKTAISDITNNDVVLSICKGLAEALAVPYARVTDAYGGYHGSPSPSLPKATAVTKTTTAKNTTANATKKVRLLNTTNATKTSWALNLFVQPDPFAAKVDNAATVAAAAGTAALAAIDKVTKAKYGAATAKAATIT